jgi:hypothetical protein
MRGTRFQFSILTMLVCTAALAVAIAACVSLPVRFTGDIVLSPTVTVTIAGEAAKSPNPAEVALRMAWAGPLAVFVSLCLLWASRRIVNFMGGV